MNISSQTAGNRGFATLAVLAILSIILIFVTANARRIQALDRELKLVEQRQIDRARHSTAATPDARSPQRPNASHGPN